MMSTLRILHISHAGLPDIRVEKTALTMKKQGHEVIFLGGLPIRGQHLNVFEETHHVPLGNSLQIVFDPRVKRRWIREISKLKPDFIHAHNCIVAHFLIDEDFAVIFNDHELMSKQTAKFEIRPFIRRMAVKPMAMSFAKWERALAERFPVITTHPNMTKEYQKIAKFVTTVPNVPVLSQVEGLDHSYERHGNVYVGGDFNLKRFIPYRDLDGLRNLIEFDIITGVSHREMLERLLHYKVGLTTWHPHPWHKYSDANRNYEYFHGGLPVLTNRIIKNALFEDIPFAYAFDKYSEIPQVIEEMQDVDHQAIGKYALEHFIWEKFEPRIIDAYKRF